MNRFLEKLLQPGNNSLSPSHLTLFAVQPYNFERLLFYLSGSNHAEVKAWMTTVDSTSKNDLSPEWLKSLQAEFRCERVEDDEMCATIRQVLSDHNYMIDPHTAVAFAAAQKLGYYRDDNAGDTVPKSAVVLLSTASPCKFEHAVTIAVGQDAWKKYSDSDFPDRGKAILALDERKPYLYEARPGASLEESQRVWRMKSANIIAEFGNVGMS